MAFLLNSQPQGVSGKVNNLPKYHGAGPPEVRDPMLLHRLHELKAGPVWRSCIPNLSCDHFKQMCAATDKITSELFLPHEAI